MSNDPAVLSSSRFMSFACDIVAHEGGAAREKDRTLRRVARTTLKNPDSINGYEEILDVNELPIVNSFIHQVITITPGPVKLMGSGDDRSQSPALSSSWLGPCGSRIGGSWRFWWVCDLVILCAVMVVACGGKR